MTPSVIFLVLANMVPLYGVVFLDWGVFPIILVFWLENVIIGVFNVLRMLAACPDNPALPMAKFFMIPFFAVHYGIFTLVHGVFVIVLFGSGTFPPAHLDINAIAQAVSRSHLGYAVLALVLSHGVSFVHNYLMQGEYRRVQLDELMNAPYGRVVVLHLAILFGGFLLMALHSPELGLLLLVLLKIGLDVRSHWREHAKLGPLARGAQRNC